MGRSRVSRDATTGTRDDGYVSDDERDEDADGLTNYDEDTGRMSAGLVGGAATTTRARSRSASPAPRPFDADTDGDGILDGADDQDFDDVPNIMELSRSLAGGARPGRPARRRPAQVGNVRPINPKIWVNPFNPCLPDRDSRTCPRHPMMGAPYAPFKRRLEAVRPQLADGADVIVRGPARCAGPRSF